MNNPKIRLFNNSQMYSAISLLVGPGCFFMVTFFNLDKPLPLMLFSIESHMAVTFSDFLLLSKL